jgi:Tol biopolymer transport system component
LFATACGGHRESVAPTPAHAGLGKLAYVQDSDIWLKSLPDGQPQRITTSAQASSPRWFLSGEWLTFGDGQTTWVVREDGTGLRKLDGFSSWSPVDDRYVGIDSGIDSGGYITVFTENADGSDRRVVVKYFPSNGHLTTQIRGSLWSPDGRWIAYTMLQQGIPEMPPYRAASMWLVSADGGTPAKVYDAGSPSRDDIGLMGWSPDGHALFFTLDPFFSATIPEDGLTLQALVVLPTADGARRPVPFAPNPATMLLHDELWARQPAASTIAVTDGSGRETWTNKRIAIVAWDAGTVTDVTPPDVAAMEPAWSPDGSRIAYVAAPDAGGSVSGGDPARSAMANRKIWVMDANGSNQHELTHDSAYRDERPQWTADGTGILFARLDANDKASLSLVPADGGTPSPVVDDLGPLPNSFGPAWWGYYGYIGWDSLFALWSAPASARPAAATNTLSMASLGLTLRYPEMWSEGAAVETWAKGTAAQAWASCGGCTIVGPLPAPQPYGVEVFTEDLDPGCAVSCYVGNNAIGPGDTPLGPASQESVRVADIESKRMEVQRQVPLGVLNATGDDTPYLEIWTLVPWYGKALFFVAFFREGDRAAEAETRAAYDAMLTSVTRVPNPSSGEHAPPRPATASVGQTISVWGYADASPTRDNCISALPDMTPASADIPGGKLITCTVDPAAASRLRFLEDGAGVLHLSSVEILLPATAAPPNGLETDCNDLRSILLPGSTIPARPQVKLVCLAEPPARGTVSASRAEFWAYVLPNTGPTAASAPVDCWELARFIGAPAAADAVMVPCLLSDAR